jgi:hypothetical protein
MCSTTTDVPVEDVDVPAQDEAWAGQEWEALLAENRAAAEVSPWGRFAHLFTLEPGELDGSATGCLPTDGELLRRLRDCEALVTQLVAEQSRYLLELHRRRLTDQAAAHPHEDGVCASACCDDDGWVTLEVGQELALSERQVSARLDTARRLARHGEVARAMDAGRLQSWTATKLLEHLETLAPFVTVERLAEIESATLAWLLERPRTVAQLNARMRRLLLQVRDAGQDGEGERPPPAVQDRGTGLRPTPTSPGMAELVALLPEADALVLAATLGALAGSPVSDSDTRSTAQRRADLLVTLVTGRVARWGEDADLELALRSAGDVQVRLDVTLPLTALGTPAAADAGIWTGTAGSGDMTGAAGSGGCTADVAGYGGVSVASAQDLVRGHATTGRPLVYDPTSGRLLGFGATGVPLRWLSSVPASSGYAHSPGLDRALRLRDGMCRAPGCARPARRCDCDHVVPYPRGETSLANSCCLCRRHHRLKTHAPGWAVRVEDDGTLVWTTPTGTRLRTEPADYGAFDPEAGLPDASRGASSASSSDPDVPPF